MLPPRSIAVYSIKRFIHVFIEGQYVQHDSDNFLKMKYCVKNFWRIIRILISAELMALYSTAKSRMPG